MEMRRNFRFQESPQLLDAIHHDPVTGPREGRPKLCKSSSSSLGFAAKIFYTQNASIDVAENAKNMTLILYVMQVYHL